MGDLAAYTLSVATGLAGSAWALTSHRRRYQVSRDRPPTAKYALLSGVAVGMLLISFAWLFNLDGVFLAGSATLIGVYWFGALVWPLFRT